MFVRKKKNPSGIVSIQIIDKSKGNYQVVKTIGSSCDASTIESMYLQGKKWISSYLGEQDIFELHDKAIEEQQFTEYLLSNVENILLNGTQLILNNVFKLTGFDLIEDENKLVFIVDRKANKYQIKEAIEALYKVKVTKINTLISPRGQKKAFIKLNSNFSAADLAIKLGIF